jgi:hypothetical protein
MFALATVTLTSTASSISFTNIPADYTHLQIRGFGRNNRPSTWIDTMYISFNENTTGSSYNSHTLGGNGSSAFGSSAVGQTGYGAPIGMVGATTFTTSFGHNIIDILDYKNTNKNKTIRTLTSVEDNTNGSIRLTSGLWMSTAAITSITLVTDGASVPANALFQANSSFALYGIKAG